MCPREASPVKLAPQDLAPSDLARSDLAPSDLARSDLAPQDLARSDLAYAIRPWICATKKVRACPSEMARTLGGLA
jgi:hypothetical protein